MNTNSLYLMILWVLWGVLLVYGIQPQGHWGWKFEMASLMSSNQCWLLAGREFDFTSSNRLDWASSQHGE